MIQIRINEKNINTLKFPEPQDIEIFYFDSLFTCNIKCIYCHHSRNTRPVGEDDFKRFLDTQVRTIGEFSLGCGMEPTMDKRMVNFAKIVSNSNSKPRHLKLQTNGTIVHIHNIDELAATGINSVCISLDSVDPEVHRIQRGGSNLDQIISNIKMLRKKLVNSKMGLMATVTKLSAPTLDAFAQFALDNGINGLTLRNLYHFPGNNMLKSEEHDWMRSMLIPDEVFLEKCNELVEKYKNKMEFRIMTTNTVRNKEKDILT